jgi:membrane protein DedA with SNARE-associated domain
MDRFLVFLGSLPDLLIYFILGVSALIENVFPPVPGDTVTAFGAFLVGINRLDFLGVYISTTLGSLAGFMLLFWIGGLLGRRFFIEKDLFWFKAEDIIRAEIWFKRYGYFLILINRFLPGIRSVISVVSGLTRLRPLQVSILALLSCATWNLIWIAVGYALGANWETAKGKLHDIMASYNFVILVAVVFAVAFFVTKKFIRRH